MNLLIDLDGTLTDPKKGITACIQHALRSLGYNVPEEATLIRYIGPPLKEAFRELLPIDKHSEVDLAIEKYRERFTDIGMFENSVYPGIAEALESLRSRGARLLVATSKPRVFAERILEHFELSHYFEKIYGSELDGTRTNKAHLISFILSSSSLNPAHTTMVGDRLHDAMGAIANGVKPVGVLWGYGGREELLGAGVVKLLEAPRDLGSLALTNVSASGG
jgi:phosphoglycolate phosphatase